MHEAIRSYRYDVFVAYDRRDAAIVDSLARHLTTEGFRVWLDTWELIPGAPAKSVIEKAAADSSVFALCIGERSPESLDSDLELASATYGSGAGPRIVPILLPGATGVPAKLADRFAVDIREGFSREAMDRLIRAISAARSSGTAKTSSSGPSTGEMLRQIDYRSLVNHLNETLQADLSNKEALRARIFACMALGRQEQALEDLERLAAMDPDDLMVITSRVTLLVALGKPEEVSRLVREAEQRAPRVVDEMAKGYIGKTDAEVERDLSDLSRVLEYSDRYSARRWVTAIRTDRDKAVGMLRAEFAMLEAVALQSSGEQEASMAARRRAVALDPEKVQYRFQMIVALKEAGRQDELARCLDEWGSRSQESHALLSLAVKALRGGKSEEGLEILGRAVARDPEEPTVRAMRVDLLTSMERVADSAEDLRVLWENNPSNWKILSRLMSVFQVLGRLDEEADMLEAWADNIEPLVRAMTRKPGGAQENGEKRWLRNLDRLLASGELADQRRARASVLRIQARLNEKKPAEALQLARQAVSKWPRQYAGWASAADLLGRMPGETPVEASPGEPQWVSLVWGALVKLGRGEKAEASALMSQSMEQARDVGVVQWIDNLTKQASGAFDDALASLNRAVEIDRIP